MESATATAVPMTLHHGLGNEFVVADLDTVQAATIEAGLPDIAAFARRVCDRTDGVGADGLLLIGPYPEGTAQMILYNADGSRAEISGNGIRCFAHALAMRAGSLAAQLISTDVGDRRVELTATDDPHTVMARVPMGTVSTLGVPEHWETLGANPDRPVAHLSLGNPHSVVGVDDVDAVDLAALGSKVPHLNLEIIEPGQEPDQIRMRVHERGVGITRACGTGACAAAHAAVSWGLVPASVRAVRVQMEGGEAIVEVNTPGPGDVVLTGPATFVRSLEYRVGRRP